MAVLEGFCTTPLWNETISWNSGNPYLTECFEHLVLVTASCAVLWILAPIEFVKIAKKHGLPNPWSSLNITKVILKIILLLICLIDISRHTYAFVNIPSYGLDGLVASIIYTVTIFLSLSLSLFARKRGALITLALPSFWLLGSVTTLMSMYTEIQNYEKGNWNNTLGLADDIIVVIISILQLVLSSFAEKPAPPSGRISFISENFCPLDSAPLPSRITFSWMISLFVKGLKNSLHQDHLIQLCSELKSSSSAKKLLRMKQEHQEREIVSSRASSVDERSKLIQEGTSTAVYTEPSTLNVRKKHFWVPHEDLLQFDSNESLMWILFKNSKKFLLMSSFLELLSVAFAYLPPYVLSLFLTYIQNDDFKWHGYAIAVALYLAVTVPSLIDTQQKYHNLLAAMQIKASLVNTIYSKVFRLNKLAKEKHTVGHIGNYMGVDAEKVFKLANICTQLWSVPLRIAIGLYILWTFLGPSSLMGLAVLFVMVPITWIVAVAVSRLQKKRMMEKDKRLSLLSEIFHGIKALKLYAWEQPFLEKVRGIRQRELSHLRKAEYLDICFSFLYSTAPSLVALASFATYLLVNKNHTLEVNMVFVSLSVINLLRFPLSYMSVLMSIFIEARVSLARLQNFLDSDELDFKSVGSSPDLDDCATVNDGTFSWSPDEEPTLRNINLNIKRESLVAVIGEVGSGKSSLINAFLGELHKIGGTIDIQGSIAYVGQQPWLLNATLEQNILFTAAKDDNFYQCVLNACALLPDLENLPAGDHTEIGEKGINLSGGQKQRVSLARGIYQNADAYFLDDPLSAVDAHVAAHLFQRVIGPEGLLRNKTRLFVTHNYSFLPQVDWIVVMKNGEIAEQGTYEELMESNGILSIYMEDLIISEPEEDLTSSQVQKFPIVDEDDKISDPAVIRNNGQLIEEENVLNRRDPWSIYFGYIQSIGPFPVMLAILTAGLYCTCEMATGVWLSNWSDDYKLSERNYRLTVYAGLVLSQGLFVILSAAVLFTGSSISANKLHKCLLFHLIRAPQSFFDTTPTGRILNRFGTDVEAVDVEIPRALNIWICAVLWLPAVFVVLSFTSPFITIAFLPLILIYYFIQTLYVSTSRQLRHLTSATSSPLYSHFNETLFGITSIRAFRAVGHFLARSHERMDTHLNCFFLSMVSTRWLEVCLNILGGFIVLITACLAVLERDKGAGIIGLSLVYSMQITQGLSVLIRLSSQLETSMVALERIKEYSEVKQEAEWRNPAYQPTDSWPQKGAISIQSLSTTYREGFSPILHNVNITVKPGEKVGIVGRTGAGKSTLALTLFRLIEPTEGRIFVDNVNILCIGLHDLRSKLTIIPQDPVVFSGTIRSNLDPFNTHKDEKLWEALSHAHLKNKVSELEGGLDHRLSAGGDSFSAGQCQLLCLARCLLRKSKVLILDEATASIDPHTDQLIQETVKEICSESTVIAIAHRLSSILDYHRVIVLANGEVIEDGCPQELILDSNSSFFSLAVDAGLVTINNVQDEELENETS